ncbi:hypothetical protein DFQ27_007299, partial [Actinomortierella ambigua]
MPRCGHLASLSGDFMVVFGGKDAQDQHVQEISVLDLQRRIWVLGGHFHRPCSDDRSMMVNVDEPVQARRRRRYREAFERDAVLRRLSGPPSTPSSTHPSTTGTPVRGGVGFARRPSNASDVGGETATSPTSPRRLSQPLSLPAHSTIQLCTMPDGDSSKLIPFLNPRKDSWHRGEGEPFDYCNLGAAMLDHIQPTPPPRPPSKYTPLSPRLDLSAGGRRRTMSESMHDPRARRHQQPPPQLRPSFDLRMPTLNTSGGGLDLSPTTTVTSTTAGDASSIWSASTTATTLHDALMSRKNSTTSSMGGIKGFVLPPSLPPPPPLHHLQPGTPPTGAIYGRKLSVGQSSILSHLSDRSTGSAGRRSQRNIEAGNNNGGGTMGGTTLATPEPNDLALAFARQRKRAATMDHPMAPLGQPPGVGRAPVQRSHGLAPSPVRSPSQSNLIPGSVPSSGVQPQPQQQSQQQIPQHAQPLVPPSRVLNVNNNTGPSNLMARMVAENRKSRELSDLVLRESMEFQAKQQQQQQQQGPAPTVLPSSGSTTSILSTNGALSPGSGGSSSMTNALPPASKAFTAPLSSVTTFETNQGTATSTSTSKSISVSPLQPPPTKPTKPTLYLYSNSHDPDPKTMQSLQKQKQQQKKRPIATAAAAAAAAAATTAKEAHDDESLSKKVYREFIKIQPATHARATTGLLLAGKIMFDIDNEWAGLDEVVAGNNEHGLPPRLYYPMGHVVNRFLIMSGQVSPDEEDATVGPPQKDPASEASATTALPQDQQQSQQQQQQQQDATTQKEVDSFAIWRHNFETHEWTRLELPKSLSNGRWYRSVLDSRSNMLYILGRKNAPASISQSSPSSGSSSLDNIPQEGAHEGGSTGDGVLSIAVSSVKDEPPEQSQDHPATIPATVCEGITPFPTPPPSSSPPSSIVTGASSAAELCFEHLVEVDLEGVDMPRGLDEESIGALGIQMGLEMLRDGVGADCVLVSKIDGGRVRVNSAIVGQRWGCFQRLMRDYERMRDLEIRHRTTRSEYADSKDDADADDEEDEHEHEGEYEDKEAPRDIAEAHQEERAEEEVNDSAAPDGDKETAGASSEASIVHEQQQQNEEEESAPVGEHDHDEERGSEAVVGDRDETKTQESTQQQRQPRPRQRRPAAPKRNWHLSDRPIEWQVPETTPILVAFLQYCYTNTLSTAHQLKMKTLQGLLLLAHHYDLTRLRQLCIWALSKHHLTKDNAPQICETAILTQSFGLHTRALRVQLQAARSSELRQQSETNEYRKRLEFVLTRVQTIEEDRRRMAAQQAQRQAWQQGYTLSPAELKAAMSAAAGVGSDPTSGARLDRVGSPIPWPGSESGGGGGSGLGSRRSPLPSPSTLSTVERAGGSTLSHTSFVSRLFKSSKEDGSSSSSTHGAWTSAPNQHLDPAAIVAAIAAASNSGGGGRVSPDPCLQHGASHRRTMSISAAFHSLGHHHHHHHHHHHAQCQDPQQLGQSQQPSQQPQQQQLQQQQQPQPQQQQQPIPAQPPQVLTVQGPAAPAKSMSPQPLDLPIRPEDAEKLMAFINMIQQGEPVPRLSALGLIESGLDFSMIAAVSGGGGRAGETKSGDDGGQGGRRGIGSGLGSSRSSHGLAHRPNLKRSTESMLLADAETEVDSEDLVDEDEYDDEEKEEGEEVDAEEEKKEGDEDGDKDEEKDEDKKEQDATNTVAIVEQQSQPVLDQLAATVETTMLNTITIPEPKALRTRMASHDDSKNRSKEDLSSSSSTSSSSAKSHLRSKSLHHLASVVTAAMTGGSKRLAPLSSSTATGAEGVGSSSARSKSKRKGGLLLPAGEDELTTGGSSSNNSSSSNLSSMSLAPSTSIKTRSRASSTTSQKEKGSGSGSG